MSFPFSPELTLPDSTAGFKLEANVEAASVVNEISIYTDASAFGSDPVKCTVETTNIVCKNIGKLSSNQTKYLKFAFVVKGTDYNAGTELAKLGAMIIKTNDVAANTITTSIMPSDILYSEIYDADYEATGNRVIDIKEPASGFLAV